MQKTLISLALIYVYYSHIEMAQNTGAKGTPSPSCLAIPFILYHSLRLLMFTLVGLHVKRSSSNTPWSKLLCSVSLFESGQQTWYQK